MPEYELEVENSIDSLPVISSFVEDNLVRFGVDTATINRIQLVVDEASTNVIKYAYPEGKGTLKLTLELTGNELVVTLTDRGKPFDPTTAPAPDLEAGASERKIGGLGVYFMRKIMDTVSYSYDVNTGNRLTLKKKLTEITSTNP